MLAPAGTPREVLGRPTLDASIASEAKKSGAVVQPTGAKID
jgi:hypothetical protein